jgi:hypothetical protein
VRGGCIGPGITERPEASAAIGHCAEHVEQIARGSRQPIEYIPNGIIHFSVLPFLRMAFDFLNFSLGQTSSPSTKWLV